MVAEARGDFKLRIGLRLLAGKTASKRIWSFKKSKGPQQVGFIADGTLVRQRRMLGEAACGWSVAGNRLTRVESGVKVSGDFGGSDKTLTTEVRAQRIIGFVKSKSEVSRPAAKTLRTAAMVIVSGALGVLALAVAGEEGPSESSWFWLDGLGGGNDMFKFKKGWTVDGRVSSKSKLTAEGSTVAENLTNETSGARLDGSRSTGDSLPSEVKNPRQVRLPTWKK